MEREFRRSVHALEEVFDFVSEATSGLDLDEGRLFQIKLAIEEVFVNMVRHSTGGSDILIDLAREGDRLVVSLTDSGVDAFDPTKAEEYDTARPLDERPVGRLGIHLVKTVVDDIIYRYENRQSRITLIKNLGKTDV
jgi:serine/threonine-protein kinase RsbW